MAVRAPLGDGLPHLATIHPGDPRCQITTAMNQVSAAGKDNATAAKQLEEAIKALRDTGERLQRFIYGG